MVVTDMADPPWRTKCGMYRRIDSTLYRGRFQCSQDACGHGVPPQDPAWNPRGAGSRMEYANYLEVSAFGRGTNLRATELMQNRMPVGCGPSSKMCPRCASHRLHTTSVRFMKWLWSGRRVIASRSASWKKLGHPQPEWNLVLLSNSFCPQQTHWYSPSAIEFQYSPVYGDSVPRRRVTSNCSGVSLARHSSSVVTGFSPVGWPSRGATDADPGRNRIARIAATPTKTIASLSALGFMLSF